MAVAGLCYGMVKHVGRQKRLGQGASPLGAHHRLEPLSECKGLWPPVLWAVTGPKSMGSDKPATR
ncbi:hypothetical protein QIS74_05450 [Colletotrichum tabaci]|uniref:Uncharacterized protein n=1 Tax=Colletotrichum tabaci TaxID=1209068 RepID=A0AAV9TFG1_9PEZI